jgi:hypothetical protein
MASHADVVGAWRKMESQYDLYEKAASDFLVAVRDEINHRAPERWAWFEQPKVGDDESDRRPPAAPLPLPPPRLIYKDRGFLRTYLLLAVPNRSVIRLALTLRKEGDAWEMDVADGACKPVCRPEDPKAGADAILDAVVADLESAFRAWVDGKPSKMGF